MKLNKLIKTVKKLYRLYLAIEPFIDKIKPFFKKTVEVNMNIKVKHIDLGKPGRPGKKLKSVNGIVLHSTGTPDATAENEYNYFQNKAISPVSAHYFVDKDEILEIIPPDEYAYHAGANSYNPDSLAELNTTYPNARTLSIEMCEEYNKSIHKSTYEKTVELTVYLLKKYKLGINNLFKHFDITGKRCPHQWMDNNEWDHFIEKVKNLLE